MDRHVSPYHCLNQVQVFLHFICNKRMSRVDMYIFTDWAFAPESSGAKQEDQVAGHYIWDE